VARDPSLDKQITARLLANKRLVDRYRRPVKTKIPLVASLLLFGCSTHSPSGTPPGDDGGVDGGVDGGTPDGGVDAGVCTSANTIVEVPLECRAHIPEFLDDGGMNTPQYLHNPPVSGEHYPIWARWQKYTTTVPRGYWVHNLEHGGVIFLYRPDAPQSVKDALNRVYDAIRLEQDCVDQGLPHNRSILTPDPLLDVPWAVTVSGPEIQNNCPDGGQPEGVGYQIKSDCVASEQALVDFAVNYRNQSIEEICDQGDYPYPP